MKRAELDAFVAHHGLSRSDVEAVGSRESSTPELAGAAVLLLAGAYGLYLADSENAFLDQLALAASIAGQIMAVVAIENILDSKALTAGMLGFLQLGGLAVRSPHRYRIRNGRAWVGTNAYFFEEGTAQRYEPARFGEFRLDRDSGEAVLVGMRDGNLEPL